MKELIFVYNADSSLTVLVKDYFTKVFIPKKYECNLCMITYGNLGVKNKWKEFIQELQYKTVFLHKDEFFDIYPDMKNEKLPAVFIKSNSIRLLISAAEINRQSSVNDLITLIKNKLNK